MPTVFLGKKLNLSVLRVSYSIVRTSAAGPRWTGFSASRRGFFRSDPVLRGHRMNCRLINIFGLSVLATVCSALLISNTGWGYAPQQTAAPAAAAPATPPAAPQTEDIILTSDGRELHGKIISESKTA